MTFLKTIPFIVLLGIAGGCATQAMNHAVAAKQNQQASAVIADWGRPSEELRVSGRHLLLWNTFDGVPALPEQKKPSAGSAGLYCLRFLEVGRDGRIMSGRWEGNDCPGWLSGWYR